LSDIVKQSDKNKNSIAIFVDFGRIIDHRSLSFFFHKTTKHWRQLYDICM